MRPQFHLPLTTHPEASSFAIIENAIQFSLHQGADLVAILAAARRHGHEAAAAHSDDDKFLCISSREGKGDKSSTGIRRFCSVLQGNRHTFTAALKRF